MTIFDMLLTKPLVKKGGAFVLSGSAPQKEPSFESVLLSLLNGKKTSSMLSMDNGQIQTQNLHNKKSRITHVVVDTPSVIQAEKMPQKSSKEPEAFHAVTYGGGQQNAQQNARQKKTGINDPYSTVSMHLQRPSRTISHHARWSEEQSPLKKSFVMHSAQESQTSQSRVVKSVSEKEESKTGDLKRLRKSVQNEHSLTATEISLMQKPNHISQMHSDIPKTIEQHLKKDAPQALRQNPQKVTSRDFQVDHRTQKPLLKENEAQHIRSVNLASEYLGVKKAEQEKPQPNQSEASLELHDTLSKHEQAHRSITQKSFQQMHASSEPNLKSNMPNHQKNDLFQSEKSTAVANSLQGSEQVTSTLFTKSAADAIATKSMNDRTISKKSLQIHRSQPIRDDKRGVVFNKEIDSMPNVVANEEKPQIGTMRRVTHLQQPVQTPRMFETNGDYTVTDVATQNDEQSSGEREVLGMSHFDERNFELHDFQKEIRFLKIDQARVQVRMHHDQLHLDFLSQAPLMTDGVEEYIEHVMQEHGFENYRVRLKDRKRDLLIESQKSTTSHEARSMIDVKV